MKKILIVEDELIVRLIYRRKFEISGYQVETAEEGTAALQLIGTFKPDAVQVDIMMPGMDGVEVIRQIRAWPDFKNIPILVISSFYRPDLAKEAWKAGATKCVSKMDCTPNLALELVEQMLSGEGGGASPFAKLGMSAIPNDAIRVMPAESPWEEATQILTRKPVPSAGPINAAAPAAAPVVPAPKPPSTLPNFAREQMGQAGAAPTIAMEPAVAAALGAAKTTTTPNFSKPPGSGNTIQFTKAEAGNTVQIAKPEGGHTIQFDKSALDAPPPVANKIPSTGNTQQFNRGDFGGTRQFTKPDPEGSRITTRPKFASPPAQKLSKPAPEPEAAPAAVPAPAPVEDFWPQDESTPADTGQVQGGTSFRLEIRQEFLKRAPQIQSDLRDRVSSLLKSKSTTEQINLLRDLETSVGSLASLSGITGFSRISHLAGALDALIKDLHKKPAQMTNSVLRTVAHASDCLNTLFRDLERAPREIPQSMLILAVDDEPIARRTISVALGKANLRCISMEDSRAALSVLRENAFDLIFLDAEMPELNGFQLCTELRKLPTNKTTPVIFVTSLTKFEVRAQSSLAGGNDLIAKPFLMMELAVKALTYLLRPQTIPDQKAK